MTRQASVRTQILLSPKEHREWTAAARRKGISLGEYVRRSVVAAEDAPTPEELAELEALTIELEASYARMNDTLDRAFAQMDYNSDPAREAEMRARVAEELRRDPVEIDPDILDFSGVDPGVFAR